MQPAPTVPLSQRLNGSMSYRVAAYSRSLGRLRLAPPYAVLRIIPTPKTKHASDRGRPRLAPPLRSLSPRQRQETLQNHVWGRRWYSTTFYCAYYYQDQLRLLQCTWSLSKPLNRSMQLPSFQAAPDTSDSGSLAQASFQAAVAAWQSSASSG